MSDETLKYLLPESEIPTHWINLMPDLPGPPPSPPLHPGTKEPAGPDDLSPIFPMGLIQQEVATEPEVEIPDEVRDVYRRWRPSPLHRARAGTIHTHVEALERQLTEALQDHASLEAMRAAVESAERATGTLDDELVHRRTERTRAES